MLKDSFFWCQHFCIHAQFFHSTHFSKFVEDNLLEKKLKFESIWQGQGCGMAGKTSACAIGILHRRQFACCLLCFSSHSLLTAWKKLDNDVLLPTQETWREPGLAQPRAGGGSNLGMNQQSEGVTPSLHLSQ